jgi:hypothetical protein
MTDKEDKEGKILIGPWDKPTKKNSEETKKWIKEKYDRALEKKNIQLKMQEKLARAEMITENIMVQLIHTLGEYGYEIGKEDFILDVGFLSEAVKSVIHRQEKIPHVVQGLIDNLMSPENTKSPDGGNIHYSRFNSPLLSDLIGMAETINERKDSLKDSENDVEFEPDMEFDLEDVTNWNKDKDKDDKDKDKE